MFDDGFKNYILLQQDHPIHFTVDREGVPEGGFDFLLDVPSKVFIMPRPMWRDILSLGLRSGWVAMGTKHPNHYRQQNGRVVIDDDWSNWDGNYTSRAFQLVIKEDALGLGEALAKTLPKSDAAMLKEERQAIVACLRDMGMRFYDPGALSTLVENIDADQLHFRLPDWRKRKQFVDFCQAGGFYIAGS